MDPNSDNETDFELLYNGLNSRVIEFNEFMSQMVFELSQQKAEILRLRQQNREVLSELHIKSLEFKSLQDEKHHIEEDRDRINEELRDLRNENDILRKDLQTKNSLYQSFCKKAEELVQYNNGLIVNSLPAFSEQMVLSERPNSMTAFGSLANMDGMRLRPSQSKEDTYHSTRLVTSNQNSDETYYSAIGSHRSSLNNGSTGVRPKVQQNQVSSTVNVVPTHQNITEVLNESMITGHTESTSFYIDEDNNLRLKMKKPPIGRLIPVTVAYASSPSDFWLHINPEEVNDYLHDIQVKQRLLKSKNDSNLTAADITIGMYCAAIYSFDKYWYRAQITGITYGNPIERDSIKSVTVLFIDWGNSEERPLSHVMRLSMELTERRQALNCYIQGCGQILWPQKDRQEFAEMVKKLSEEKKLMATFNKEHKIKEDLIDSIMFPVNLVIELSDGTNENLYNNLTIPDLTQELDVTLKDTEQQASPSTSSAKDKSADTVVCNARLNGNSNPSLSAFQPYSDSRHNQIREQLSSIKSHSNQNCATNSRTENSKQVPKSMPLLNGWPQPEPNVSDILRIPAPIIPDTTEGLIVQASHIESPSLMYFQISDPQSGSAQLEDLDEKLNAFYSKYSPLSSTIPSEVSIGSFWATRWKLGWYRCRVISFDGHKVFVNYVDYGNEEWVHCRELMPLTRQFSIYPAMAVKSRLSNVYPIGGGEEWSEESLNAFADLIDLEKPLTAFIAQKPNEFGFDSFLDVFLWTSDSNSDDVLINLQLVVENCAQTDCEEWVIEASRWAQERANREKTPDELMSAVIPIVNNRNSDIPSTPTTSTISGDYINPINGDINTSTHVPNGHISDPILHMRANGVRILPELPDEWTDEDEWDPIAEDAACELNNYNIRPDDPSIATMGFRPSDRLPCKFYGTPKGCRFGDMCSFLHIDREKRFEIDDTEEELMKLREKDLKVDSYVALKVTSIHSPYLFYGVLPFGDIDLLRAQITDDFPPDNRLREMCSQIKSRYSSVTSKENPNVFPALGSLVAYREQESDDYFRGRVVSCMVDEGKCTIFNIDLGFEVEVKRNQVFKLGPFLAQTPPLAIECSLTGIQPLNSIKWSRESVEFFKEWVRDKVLCAHIMYGRTEDKYYLELIDRVGDQEINLADKLVELKFAQRVVFKTPEENGSEDSEEIYNSDVD